MKMIHDNCLAVQDVGSRQLLRNCRQERVVMVLEEICLTCISHLIQWSAQREVCCGFGDNVMMLLHREDLEDQANSYFPLDSQRNFA